MQESSKKVNSSSFSLLGLSKPSSRFQPCPRCQQAIGNIAGSKEAICTNCGFKDPCCE